MESVHDAASASGSSRDLHALFGLYQVSTDEVITDRRRNPVSTTSYTDNSAAFVLGAGLNIMPNHRIGFRARST